MSRKRIERDARPGTFVDEAATSAGLPLFGGAP